MIGRAVGDAYKVLVGKAGGMRPLGKPRLGEKIILKWVVEKWFGSMDWIDLAQDRGR
jgi:hypothetical protein